jgi:nucleotidyltransferase/DNA polymerase involved in DNA repair
MDPLLVIPGVGKSIAADLRELGIHTPSDLRGRNPETLFRQFEKLHGKTDRCLLYTFRCAVAYARTGNPDLKWWNFKDS